MKGLVRNEPSPYRHSRRIFRLDRFGEEAIADIGHAPRLWTPSARRPRPLLLLRSPNRRETLIDRLAQHSELILIEGRNYRLPQGEQPATA